MNKDSFGLSITDRFNLVLSDQAVERELNKIKRPVVNVETLPKNYGLQLKTAEAANDVPMFGKS